MTKYIFNNPDTGKEEIVEPVRWRWIAHFKGGDILKQYDDEDFFHRFAEIKNYGNEILYFQMVSDENPQGYKLAIPNGADLIHFYRNTRLAGQTRFHRGFIFGWKILIDGKSHKRLIAIRPDNTIALLDDDGRKERVT